MKKIPIIITLLILTVSICNTSRAQSPTIRIDAGYRVPIGGGLLGMNNSSTSVNGVYGTYGQGFSFGGLIDFYTSKKFALDIGGHYWLGTNINYSTTTGSGSNMSSETYKGKQNMVVLAFGCHYDFCIDTAEFTPYIGMGINLGVAGNLNYSETTNSTYNNNTYQTITKATITDNAALGAYSELGVNYRMSPKVSFYGELKINTMSVMPDKSVTSSLTENGVDVTSTLTPKYKETDYVKTIPASYNYTDPSQPTQQIGSPFPLSSLGFNVGLKFKF